MEVKEKALKFAFEAHDGQFRRDEPDKPMIVHPLSVGKLLEECGYDDNVIAAGYLHDVIEDTKYTLDDIRNIFGNDIANLVDSATESNREASWEERKKATIEKVKSLPLRNKAVICADKISNLEDLVIFCTKTGQVDFHNFKRGYEEYKWYFSEVYKSLIKNEETSNPLFQKLQSLYIRMFANEQNEIYFREIIFCNRQADFDALRRLCGQRDDISKLNRITPTTKPYIIDFVGTPYTGKRLMIRNLAEYYNDSGLKTKTIPSFKIPDRIALNTRYPEILLARKNIDMLKRMRETKYDLILLEKSLFQSIVLIYKLYYKEEITSEYYRELISEFLPILREYIDLVVITYTDSLTSLRRRYYQRLAVPEKDFVISDKFDVYNECLRSCEGFVDDSIFLDTIVDEEEDTLSANENQLIVANEINKRLRLRYIERIKQLGN